MKKIPTIFDRDWNGDRSRILNVVNEKCRWVFDGEGIATRKIDGTCCRVLHGELWKRRELRKNDNVPDGYEIADFDEETGKTVGWIRVGEGQDDRWHREAFAMQSEWRDGTYELIGPKIQGNPENIQTHCLCPHSLGLAGELCDVPRTFDGLRDYLDGKDIEGVIFHHPDGRMAKIKLRDFGIKRAR